MASKSYSLTLPTRYGPATYSLAIDDAAKVEVQGLPFAGLPESVPRLTYGRQWEAALDHFHKLAATLPYRVTASLCGLKPPEPLRVLTEQVQQDFPSLERSCDDYWRAHPELAGVYAFDEATMNGALFRLGRPEAFEASDSPAARLLPYLLSLLPASSDATIRLIYTVLGAMDTEAARNALLTGLELEGRHPYTTELLNNLPGYVSEDTRRRLEKVYRAGRIADDDLGDYLRLLSVFNSPDLMEHLTELLTDHPAEVADIVAAMRANGIDRERIASVVHERFDAEEDYYALDPLLLTLNSLQVPAHAVDLRSMNERVATPRYTDIPPVNWPQQLEPAWSRLVLRTPADEALSVIGEFLQRPEPRLQRNALLQLKVLLRENPPEEPLPAGLENRLRELLTSRYDKVYVEVLNVLGRRDLPVRDREAMLDAILSVSIGSRYRFVVLTALSRVGGTPQLKSRARRYLASEIRSSAPDRLEQIGALLPFVEKYLGNIDPLRRELSARISTHQQQ